MRAVLVAVVLCWASLSALAQVRLRVVPTEAGPPVGGGGDLFTMDLSGGAEPLAGWGGIAGDRYGVTVNRSYLPTGGPAGAPAYRLTLAHDPTNTVCGPPTFCGGEHEMGWNGTAGSAPSTGQSRFARLAFRVVAGSNCEAKDSSDGSDPVRTLLKLMILADGAPGRTIIEVRCDPPGTIFELRLSVDGDGVGDVENLVPGTWYYVQTETVVGTGGAVRMWVNNNTYASPDASASPRDMGVSGYNAMALGYYLNRQLGVAGSFALDYAAFEYATTFDAAWFPGG